MRAHALAVVLVATLAGCEKPGPTPGGSGTGGAPATGGRPATATGGAPVTATGGTTAPAATGGTTGTGGSVVPAGTGGTAPVDTAPAPVDVVTPETPPGETAPVTPGGSALLVIGQVPPIGSDIQIQQELEAKGLTVEAVLDSKSTTAQAAGKRLVILSYSVDSEEVTTKFTDVDAAVMVMEHVLLEPLGMTGKDHRWEKPATQITIVDSDSPLAAMLPKGDVTVYSRSGSVFWGVPAPAAKIIATVKGAPGKPAYFTYDKGAMMASKPAPGKRMLFFLGAHLVPEQFLNPTGLKLLGAAIAWTLQ